MSASLLRSRQRLAGSRKTVTVGGVTRRVVVPASKVGDISDLSKSVNVKPAAGNWVQKTDDRWHTEGDHIVGWD